jgi:hypothetical protein
MCEKDFLIGCNRQWSKAKHMPTLLPRSRRGHVAVGASASGRDVVLGQRWDRVFQPNVAASCPIWVKIAQIKIK